MKLRRQLLAISLITLILPWAGVQLLRQMASALEAHHAQNLGVFATAGANLVANNPQALAALVGAEPLMPGAPALIAPPLNSELIMDGYKDDWYPYPWRGQALFNAQGQPAPSSLRAGVFEQTLFLLLEVTDASRNYYIPNQLSNSDHIQVVLPEIEGWLEVYTAAPGLVQVIKRTPLTAVPMHKVTGSWVETEQGYRVELSMPVSLVQGGFQLMVFEGKAQVKTGYSATGVSPVIVHQPVLQSAVLPLAVNPGQWYIANTNGFIVAKITGPQAPLVSKHSSNSESDFTSASTTPVMPNFWMRFLIGQPKIHQPILGGQVVPEGTVKPWANPMSKGQFDLSGLSLGAQSQGAHQYGALLVLKKGHNTVHRVIVPIKNPEQPQQTLGFLVADQDSNMVQALLTGTAGHLLLYSVGATFLAALLGVLYASWLSFRVGRLNRWVNATLNDQQKIPTSEFLGRKRQPRMAWDEIGELTQNYATLTERLNAYSDYLKNLANKLSHELRTPLAVIKSSLDNLAQTVDGTTQTADTERQATPVIRYLERAQGGAERLSKILTAMSAANRLEQSLEGAELELMDLKNLLTEVTQAYQSIYPGHNIECVVTGNGPWQKPVAPDLLVQLLDKLMENAASFTPPGGAIVLRLHQPQNATAIDVENQGPPLPAGMEHSLFDSLVSVRHMSTQQPVGRKDGAGQAGDALSPFNQNTSMQNNAPPDHLGLGLYIVKLIAQFHGAQVSARNLKSGVVFSLVWGETTSKT